MHADAPARAETVGSLLRPAELLDAVRAREQGVVPAERLRTLQDRAVRDAIVLQEGIGLDVITDGEMRREAWAMSSFVLDCFDQVPGSRSYPAALSQVTDREAVFPVVTRTLTPPPGPRPRRGLRVPADVRDAPDQVHLAGAQLPPAVLVGHPLDARLRLL